MPEKSSDSVPDVIVKSNCEIGEGPIWDERAGILYWVDLLGNTIFSYEPESGVRNSFNVGQNTGSIALRGKDGLIAALQHGFYFVDFERKRLQFICDPESDKKENRFNDGKCDGAGRFWAGTMSKALDSGYGEAYGKGALYCLDTGCRVGKRLDKITLSNGLCWSTDNRQMYYIDTHEKSVFGFEFDIESGRLSGKKTLIDFSGKIEGLPDGMCIDNEGMLWIAVWGGGCITRWDPLKGKLLDRIELPVPNVTCCTFGGKNLDELFITTASINTDLKKFPDAGAVFSVRPGVKGLASNRFKG